MCDRHTGITTKVKRLKIKKEKSAQGGLISRETKKETNFSESQVLGGKKKTLHEGSRSSRNRRKSPRGEEGVEKDRELAEPLQNSKRPSGKTINVAH